MNSTFSLPIRVYYEDTDTGGVVYHSNYLNFMERARTEWLRALGVNQERMLNEDRRMFVVTRTELDFIVPARFNDELIVTARLAGLSRATFDIEQIIYRDNLDGTVCCRGSVRAAFLNADTLKPQRVPASLFEEETS
ncbi:MAG TPA: tol-pal system-associated acyl-CoA thioesterase [Gammaproteobacteria bacterium]|nr:tol-pal system-associated acyl-CoA thioesterase [Gammaproteobacteria bacterium]